MEKRFKWQLAQHYMGFILKLIYEKLELTLTKLYIPNDNY